MGGEADKSHHFLGVLSEDSAYTEAAIRVGAGDRSFSLALWSIHPVLSTIGIQSPADESME